jgi:hypothetical protein
MGDELVVEWRLLVRGTFLHCQALGSGCVLRRSKSAPPLAAPALQPDRPESPSAAPLRAAEALVQTIRRSSQASKKGLHEDAEYVLAEFSRTVREEWWAWVARKLCQREAASARTTARDMGQRRADAFTQPRLRAILPRRLWAEVAALVLSCVRHEAFLYQIGVLRARPDIASVEIWAPEKAMKDGLDTPLKRILGLVTQTLRLAASGGLVLIGETDDVALQLPQGATLKELHVSAVTYFKLERGVPYALVHRGRELTGEEGVLAAIGVGPGSWVRVKRRPL